MLHVVVMILTSGSIKDYLTYTGICFDFYYWRPDFLEGKMGVVNGTNREIFKEKQPVILLLFYAIKNLISFLWLHFG